MFLKKIATAGAMSVLMATGAYACEINARVSIVGNEFPAIQTVGAEAAACSGAEVTKNLTSEHNEINLPGVTSGEYTAVVVNNSNIVKMLNDDVIRPLDDYVAKYGASLQPSQLIKIDGKVMAVAFMANAQHLMYRSDVLADLDIAVPTTYEEMLAAAEKIRAAGVMENPIGGAYAAGWNLAQEFNNMFLGHGGSHFKDGSAEPNINNEAGVATLNMMKALSEYMNPDFLTHDSNATNAEYRAGNVALLNMWGSRAASQTTAEGITDAVKAGHAVAGPMTVGGGSTPASTLWWDGWSISTNITDEEAEASFVAMMNGIRPELMADENVRTQAVWLIDGHQPTDAAIGVFEAAQMGTISYPMLPYIGLMHSALSAELSDFMQGKESAEQALSDIEAAYISAAKEAGYL